MKKRYPKIRAKIIGADSNVFNLVGIVVKSLRKNKVPDVEIKEFTSQVWACEDYNAVLNLIMDWVSVE